MFPKTQIHEAMLPKAVLSSIGKKGSEAKSQSNISVWDQPTIIVDERFYLLKGPVFLFVGVYVQSKC